MEMKIKAYQKIILLLLVVLPCFFPYGSRDYFLIPACMGNDTELLSLVIVIYSLVSLPYWFMVGALFARWVKNFPLAFMLANLPIFFNAIGETVYYGMLGMEQKSYPLAEYLIGSHIDKFNLFSISGSPDSVMVSILISTGFLLIIFSTGYKWIEKEF